MLKVFKDQLFTLNLMNQQRVKLKTNMMHMYNFGLLYTSKLWVVIADQYSLDIVTVSEKVLNHFFQSGKEIGEDRLPLHIGIDGPNVNLEVQVGFLSVLRGTSYSRDTKHLNLKKWVKSCNLTNDGRQHYPF